MLRALTPKEQAELNADRTADRAQYSTQIAACSFEVIALTGAIVERAAMTTEIPPIVAAFAGGAGSSIFLPRYLAEVTRLRGLSNTTLSLPPPALFSRY